MLRSCGAKKIHIRVCSPPVTDPCYFGIDTPDKKQLIASRMTVAEIKNFIGADSLAYLSLDGLKKASRIKSNKDYWTNKIEKTIQRDKKNTVILSKSGWIVLRFWEKDIDNDLKKCLNKIVKILK